MGLLGRVGGVQQWQEVQTWWACLAPLRTPLCEPRNWDPRSCAPRASCGLVWPISHMPSDRRPARLEICALSLCIQSPPSWVPWNGIPARLKPCSMPIYICSNPACYPVCTFPFFCCNMMLKMELCEAANAAALNSCGAIFSGTSAPLMLRDRPLVCNSQAWLQRSEFFASVMNGCEAVARIRQRLLGLACSLPPATANCPICLSARMRVWAWKLYTNRLLERLELVGGLRRWNQVIHIQLLGRVHDERNAGR